MEVWYPKAERRPTTVDGGSMIGGSPRGVLHTTETTSWAGSGHYHIEYRPGSGFRQYTPFNRAARGLRHPRYTPQTNRRGTYCIQVAVTAYARDSHRWDDQTMEDLAEFIAWCNDQFGIQPESRVETGWGGIAYGSDSPARMSDSEWLNFDGWCGHQEVPDNTHWDPGKVDWLRLLEGDDVAQFTEDEAKDLKLFLNLLRENGSSVYFVEPTIKIIRTVDEDDPNLGIETPDQVARTGVAALANELNETRETLRSV